MTSQEEVWYSTNLYFIWIRRVILGTRSCLWSIEFKNITKYYLTFLSEDNFNQIKLEKKFLSTIPLYEWTKIKTFSSNPLSKKWKKYRRCFQRSPYFFIFFLTNGHYFCCTKYCLVSRKDHRWSQKKFLRSVKDRLSTVISMIVHINIFESR